MRSIPLPRRATKSPTASAVILPAEDAPRSRCCCCWTASSLSRWRRPISDHLLERADPARRHQPGCRPRLEFLDVRPCGGLPDLGALYDPVVYTMLRTLLGANYFGMNCPIRRAVMLIAAPFGRLSYLPGLLIWTVLGLATFLWVARRHLANSAPADPSRSSPCPAALVVVISGQSSLFTAAILIAIFACLDTRPAIAGILIGILTLKPQLGLLFPILLVASGRWRTFFAAAVTAIMIAAATAILFGPQVWIDFVQKGMPVLNEVMVDDRLLLAPFMPTFFMNLRGAGLGYVPAMTVQACVTMLAIAAVFWPCRWAGSADPQLLAALFLACSVAAVPIFFLRHAATDCIAVMLLVLGQPDATGRRLAQLVFWLPLIQMCLGTLHVPWPALIAPAFAVYVLMRLRAPRSHAAPAVRKRATRVATPSASPPGRARS